MQGDDQMPGPPQNDDSAMPDNSPENEPPQAASMIFMEMMRRHAAQTDPPAASEPEPEPPTLNAPGKFATPEERRHAAALEAQRLRRVKRRQERRRQSTVGMMAGLLRSLIVIFISGALMATILSWWTSPETIDARVQASLVDAKPTLIPLETPTPMVTPNYMRRIGIISGHYGTVPEEYGSTLDPGAVCPDGLTEREINFEVAQRVVADLRERGYSVDLLEEHDANLTGYVADALISLHSNDCTPYSGGASGYLVAKAESRPEGGEDELLVNCMAQYYGQTTNMPQHFGYTRDMTDYHIFSKIDLRTPGIIVEMGFMYDDREMLTTQQDVIAQGVVDGILCYLSPNRAEMLLPVQPTPAAPTAQPAAEIDGA